MKEGWAICEISVYPLHSLNWEIRMHSQSQDTTHQHITYCNLVHVQLQFTNFVCFCICVSRYTYTPIIKSLITESLFGATCPVKLQL
ncbi:hypothetical protein FKM82_021154 [Ascaphus truei]